jgi:hypothetical protein
MFQCFDWPSEGIFCILAVSKRDLGVDEKAMFQEVSWPSELNFRLLAVPKYDLGDSRESDIPRSRPGL